MYFGCSGTLYFFESSNASSDSISLIVSRLKSGPVSSEYSSDSWTVSIHHSSHHADGSSTWLFLKNSPNATSISPKNRISVTSFLISLACGMDSTLTTSPFLNLTIGPSIVSHGTTHIPLPGLSIFIWVPTARNSTISMVNGLIPIAAKPEFLERPYLSLNPPFAIGYDKTGLPPIISRIYLSFTLGAPPSSSSDFVLPFENLSNQSQPSIFSLLAYFMTFAAFCITPSAIASRAPPLILLVSTRSKSRCETSIWSVASPVTSTGILFTASLTSSGVGEYWRLVTSDS